MNSAETARQLRGYGWVGILAILVILAGNLLFVPLSALLVLAWAQASETPWSAIGFVRPKSWVRSVAIGLVFGAFLKLALKAVVMPLLGAPAVNAHFQFLAGNPGAAMRFVLYAVIIGAGFGEETVFRGFLFERLGTLLGTSRRATIAIVVLTAVLFANAHWNQGLPGVEQAAVTGLVFGGMYALTGELVIVMVTHAAFDVMAVALIYWNLESRIAHLFVR